MTGHNSMRYDAPPNRCVSSTLRHVLQALRYTGQNPFQVSTGKYESKLEFKWRSAITVWSLLITGLTVPGLITFTVRVYEKKYIFKPGSHEYLMNFENVTEYITKMGCRRQTETSLMCLQMFNASFCLQGLVYLYCGWVGRGGIPNLLNQWRYTRLKVQEILGGFNGSNNGFSKDFRSHEYCRINTYVLTYVLVSAFTPFVICVITMGCGFNKDTILPIFVISYCGLIESLQDSKTVLMFKDLLYDYQEIHLKMEASLRGGHVEEYHVKSWREAVVAVRHQARLVSEHLATPQLSVLLQTTLFCTTGIFAATTGFQSEAGPTVTILLCVATVLGRLYCKVFFAERMTEEEGRIAVLLVARSVNVSLPVLIQMNELTNLIMQKPCEINLAGFAVMRKRLILGVMSQVVTYIIVLAQFYGG